MTVRRARPHEAHLLRDIRLRALHDDPDAFGSSLARELALPADRWNDWIAMGAGGQDQVLCVADGPEGWLGLAAGFVREGGTVELTSMWVAPEARGSGLGRQLAGAVIAWARERGARTVALHVLEGNAAAEHLYAALGFAPTGEREPLDRARGGTKVVMCRGLDADGAG
jgi:ribosomal protein S18 acetylase RimI-like enzyme